MPISPHSSLNQHQQPSMHPLIDFDTPSSSFISSSSPATRQSLHPPRHKSHSPPSRSSSRAYYPHSSPPRHHLDESDLDRFAMLFAPATPPATPTRTVDSNEHSLSKRVSQSLLRPTQHRRTRTESSTDSDFGPFVSVPPHQDPLASSPGMTSMTLPGVDASPVPGLADTSQIALAGNARNVSLDYFGRFTTTAKVASERNRKGVLEELLEHQDDPLYFLAAQMDDPPPFHQSTVLELLPEEEPELQDNATSTLPTSKVPVLSSSPLMQSQEQISCLAPILSPHESIADALASDLDISSTPHPLTHSSPHLPQHNRSPVLSPTRKRSLSSLAGLPRTGTALPPRLSGNASPPSASSPSASGLSLPLSMALDKVQGSGHEEGGAKDRELNRERQSTSPPQASLSKISSNLVSTFLSGTSKHARSATASSLSSTTAAHSSSPPAHSSSYSDYSSFASISHRGSPFVSTPFVPPSGAPGFTGDRNWDKGFYDALQRDRESGTVDIIGLGGEMERANGDKSHEGGSDLLSGSLNDGFSTGGGSALRRSGSIGDMAGRLQSTKGKVKSKGINLCGRREGTVPVLVEDVANSLRVHLPALIRLSRNWTLLYSIDQHGISLNTLYSNCEPRIPTKAERNPPSGALLVVKDSLDGMFGAWIGEGIMKGQNGFYGSGEAFLWRYHVDASPPLEVYKWSGKNDYVILCDPNFISFGGGDGHYGLYIDSSLLEGSSAPCPTFDNPILCARPPSQVGKGVGKKDISFECVGLEVWGIGPG